MEANINIHIIQNICEGVQSIHMVQDRDVCIVKTAIKLPVP